jgi:hypothetical protein
MKLYPNTWHYTGIHTVFGELCISLAAMDKDGGGVGAKWENDLATELEAVWFAQNTV